MTNKEILMSFTVIYSFVNNHLLKKQYYPFVLFIILSFLS